MESVLLPVLLLSLTMLPQANVISSTDVVRLVRTQDPVIRAAREAVFVAQADEVEAGLYNNPEVSWERENLADEREDALVVTLPIELSSARSTRVYLAGAEVAQANAEAARVTSQAVVGALTAFYRLQALQGQSAIEAQAVERLTEAARVVRRRHEEGNASGYDQSRIEIEAELAASTLRQTQAKTKQLRVTLMHLLGRTDSDLSFAGTLEADETLTVEPSVPVQVGTQASVRLLHAAAAQAGQAREAATTAWLPALVLSGGPRMGNTQTDAMGYELGVSLEIPLFTRGQGLSARASALERYAQANAKAAERASTIERDRARDSLRVARQEVQRFAKTIANQIQLLERAAQSGYREGALSIVELLDAQQTHTHLEMRQLALALALKEAEVALRAARGEYE